MEQPEIVEDYKVLNITSDAFQYNEEIPSRYTCEGDDINPPLSINGLPEEAKSLVVTMEDMNAPGGIWLHWLVWNMPVTRQIQENNVSGEQGWNDFTTVGYGGPCPPVGRHHYIFKIYALDALLRLDENVSLREVREAMGDHILAFGTLTGTYQRAIPKR